MELHELLGSAATSHRESISVLVGFVEQTRSLLMQGSPRLPDPNEAARFLRLPASLLSTLSPNEIAAHQQSVRDAIREETERQSQVRRVTQEFPALLMRMALIYRVALFDAFVSDVQLCVLTKLPELLKNDDRKLTFTVIVEAIAENRLNYVQHRPPFDCGADKEDRQPTTGQHTSRRSNTAATNRADS